MAPFPGRYDVPMSPDTRRLLGAAAANARAFPLERGDTLSLKGPSFLPALSYPAPPNPFEPTATSTFPRRRVTEALIAPDGPARSDHPFTLKLREPIRSGGGVWSQVWRCDVYRGSGRNAVESGPAIAQVVLHLFLEALFPWPESLSTFDHNTAAEVAENEHRTYNALADYQGQEISYCYGFYKFDIPSETSVLGMLLEDLTESCRTLNQHFARPGVVAGLTFEDARGLIHASLRMVRIMHLLNVANMPNGGVSILVRKNSTLESSEVVFVGFGLCTTVDSAKELHHKFQEYLAEDGYARADPDDTEAWAETDETTMIGTMAIFLGQELLTMWEDEEKVVDRLELAYYRKLHQA